MFTVRRRRRAADTPLQVAAARAARRAARGASPRGCRWNRSRRARPADARLPGARLCRARRPDGRRPMSAPPRLLSRLLSSWTGVGSGAAGRLQPECQAPGGDPWIAEVTATNRQADRLLDTHDAAGARALSRTLVATGQTRRPLEESAHRPRGHLLSPRAAGARRPRSPSGARRRRGGARLPDDRQPVRGQFAGRARSGARGARLIHAPQRRTIIARWP